MNKEEHNNDINEAPQNENVREAPPTLPSGIIGTPKKNQIQDLLPALGQYAIDDIVGNKEAIGMIMQLLLDKSEDVSRLNNSVNDLHKQLRIKSDDYIGEKTKLSERWKSQLFLQIISFLSALSLSFAFQFKADQQQFWLLLIIGTLGGLCAVAGPFIINNFGSKK